MSMMKKTFVVCAAALIAACSGVGDGNKLETLRIAQDLTKAAGEETSVKAFTCLPTGLILVGQFSKGDAGNFSSRARWSSDDETVVKVMDTLQRAGVQRVGLSVQLAN